MNNFFCLDYNSVCDFPQYGDLYSQYIAMPDHWLKDAHGEYIFQSCAGFDNRSFPHGMPGKINSILTYDSKKALWADAIITFDVFAPVYLACVQYFNSL